MLGKNYKEVPFLGISVNHPTKTDDVIFSLRIGKVSTHICSIAELINPRDFQQHYDKLCPSDIQSGHRFIFVGSAQEAILELSSILVKHGSDMVATWTLDFITNRCELISKGSIVTDDSDNVFLDGIRIIDHNMYVADKLNCKMSGLKQMLRKVGRYETISFKHLTANNVPLGESSLVSTSIDLDFEAECFKHLSGIK